MPRVLQYFDSSQTGRSFVPLLALQAKQHRASAPPRVTLSPNQCRSEVERRWCLNFLSSGPRPFVCDLYLANLSRWWKMRDYLKEDQPSFAAMMQRVDELPVVAPIWKRHWS